MRVPARRNRLGESTKHFMFMGTSQSSYNSLKLSAMGEPTLMDFQDLIVEGWENTAFSFFCC
jgi:hypothetical protein